MVIKIGLIGKGKMGKEISAASQEDPEIRLIGQASKEGIEELIRSSDVLIDFSHFHALSHYLPLVEKAKKPIVIGTTGFEPKEWESMRKASQSIPLLYSANFSLGMALLKKLIREAYKTLASHNPSIAIIETHHTQKKDAPSGSALSLKEALGSPSIPIHSLRVGKIIGDHRVEFHLDQEKLELSHIVHSRQAFAKGAITAAKFLCHQKPGFYTFEDLLLY